MTAVTLRACIVFVFIIVAMRLMGKRQLGELQPSELVTTILISNFASIPIEEIDLPLIPSLIPIIIIVALEVIISAVGMRFPAFSKLISGNNLILIKGGKADQRLLKELRMSTDDLLEALRNQEVFDIRDVELAVMETNGNLNVLKKTNPEGLTLETVFVPLILDGKLSEKELVFCKVSERDVKNELERRGLKEKDVLIMQRNRAGETYIVKKEDSQ